MNRIALLYPYFGPLPPFFHTWLKAAAYNSGFDFLLYTDQSLPRVLPPNVRARQMTFPEFCGMVQRLYDFPLALERPYKICDFRPAFGEIFAFDLVGYTHWGYGDLDVICGDFANFLTPQRLDRYEKISPYGHLSVYRNTPRMNQLYRCAYEGEEVWRQVFQDPAGHTFDEWWDGRGIEQIALAQGVQEFRALELAGVERPYKKKRLCFRFELNGESLPEDRDIVFLWQRGRLYACTLRDGETVESCRQYCYAHFQKRRIAFPPEMEQGTRIPDEFWVVPNRILCGGLAQVAEYLHSEEYRAAWQQEEENFVRFRQQYPNAY